MGKSRAAGIILFAVSIILLAYMAWNSRSYLKMFEAKYILQAGLVIIASFVLHGIKWQFITNDFSVKNFLEYNSSQILAPLPIPAQDPFRLKMLGMSEKTAANILWDRATDAIGIVIVSGLLIATKFLEQAVETTAVLLIGMLAAIVLWKAGLGKVIMSRIPEETIRKFKKELKKNPRQVAVSSLFASAFWALNFSSIEILLKNIGMGQGIWKTISAAAGSLLLSSVNPLPMAAGSLELFFSMATSLPLQVSAAVMIMYRVVGIGLQVATSALTFLISRVFQDS